MKRGRLFNDLMARVEEVAENCFLRVAFPQRLEAAIDSAEVTARVELVPFPKPP